MEFLRSILALGGIQPRKRGGCQPDPTPFEAFVYDYGLPLLFVLIAIAFIMMIFFLIQICANPLPFYSHSPSN